ncbi:MAG: hypothetical protein LAP87_26515 [Acidobacteriia bacterium]|nr:hypothetical protein [Terriglobia bacterium]
MTLLAVLVYLLALGAPIWLLHHLKPCAWYWHVFAIVVALALGLVPMPPQFSAAGFDLAFGAAVIFLLVWGIGGLVVYRPHKTQGEKHA